jgi:hypothetical protein
MTMGAAVALGVGAAIALGVALDNWAVGIAIGVGLGVALASAGYHKARKNDPPNTP